MIKKSIFKSKIFWVAVTQAVTGVFAIIAGNYEFGIVTIIGAIATIVLRKYFTTALIK